MNLRITIFVGDDMNTPGQSQQRDLAYLIPVEIAKVACGTAMELATIVADDLVEAYLQAHATEKQEDVHG